MFSVNKFLIYEIICASYQSQTRVVQPTEIDPFQRAGDRSWNLSKTKQRSKFNRVHPAIRVAISSSSSSFIHTHHLSLESLVVKVLLSYLMEYFPSHFRRSHVNMSSKHSEHYPLVSHCHGQSKSIVLSELTGARSHIIDRKQASCLFSLSLSLSLVFHLGLILSMTACLSINQSSLPFFDQQLLLNWIGRPGEVLPFCCSPPA